MSVGVLLLACTGPANDGFVDGPDGISSVDTGLVADTGVDTSSKPEPRWTGMSCGTLDGDMPDLSVRQLDGLAYWVFFHYADLLEHATLELRCRSCGHRAEQHPMTFTDAIGGEEHYTTAELSYAAGSEAIPNSTTNFPCVLQRDDKDAYYVTDWAMIVTAEWKGESRCDVYTPDAAWNATIEDETGCNLWPPSP